MNKETRAAILEMTALATTRRVLVIGDVMLDRFINGEVTRVSPEDPTCLVLSHEPPVERKLGGAANVACNLAAMGAKVDLIGLGGERKFRDQFNATLKRVAAAFAGELHYNLTDGQRRFTVKTRYCAHGKQLLRVDYEDTHNPSTEEIEQLKMLYNHLRDCSTEPPPDIAILSDYGKGTLNGDFLPWLIEQLAKDKIPYIVDPKRVDVEAFGAALALSPNHREWENICAAGHKSRAKHIIVTRGEEGCTIMPWQNGNRLPDGCCHKFPVEPAEISDSTGAGDTFVAALSLATACGLPIDEACYAANAAARLAVAHKGTVAVSLKELGEDACNG